MKALSLIILFSFFIVSCSGESVYKLKRNPNETSEVSSRQKEIIEKIAQNPPPKANSPLGYWMFFVFAKDGHKLKGYTDLIRSNLSNTGEVLSSEVVDESKLNKEDFLHAGFIFLGKGEGPNGRLFGYDTTGYGKVIIPYYNLISRGNSEYEWDFTWIPGKLDKRKFKFERFHRIAKYDAKNDVLYGTVDIYLAEDIVDKGKRKEVEIPLGSYVWKASRLSEQDFQRINSTGKRDPNLPQVEHVIALKKNDPTVKKIIEKQLEDE